MRTLIDLASHTREELIDNTARVRRIVEVSGVHDGLCCVYAHGATAAIMIQENWDASVPTDVVDFLRKLIPPGSGCTTGRMATGMRISKQAWWVRPRRSR